jgi:hypothetical protein
MIGKNSLPPHNNKNDINNIINNTNKTQIKEKGIGE